MGMHAGGGTMPRLEATAQLPDVNAGPAERRRQRAQRSCETGNTSAPCGRSSNVARKGGGAAVRAAYGRQPSAQCAGRQA